MDQDIDLQHFLTTRRQTAKHDPHTEQIPELLHQVARRTQQIKKHPYNPQHWLERAYALHKLDYPELALGDAWKAQKLVSTQWMLHDRLPGQRLGWQQGFHMQVDELTDEERAIVPQGFRDAYAAIQLFLEELLDEDGEKGSFRPRAYPWLSKSHDGRDNGIIRIINKELEGLTQETQLCEVRQTSFTHGEGTATSEMDLALGMFALDDIKQGTVVLRDVSDIYVCYHEPSSWLFGDDSRNDAKMDLSMCKSLPLETRLRSALVVKCLLASMAADSAHPLEWSVISRIRPTYHDGTGAFGYHLLGDIELPNQYLVNAGIDIFADLRYDIWILFTLRARLDNNAWSQLDAMCLAPLFAMLNHSCEPNLEWKTSNAGSAGCVELAALRQIDPGEELFISYDPFICDSPLQERQVSTSRWIPGGCRCQVCRAELAAGEAVPAEHKVSGGWTGVAATSLEAIW